MSGPVLVIELAEAIPRAAIQRLRDLLVCSSARFEEKRVGEYDLNIHAQSLGISDTGGVDGRRQGQMAAARQQQFCSLSNLRKETGHSLLNR